MEVVAEWFQAMFARVSKFVAEHPTMETLKSAHGKIMNQFTALSDATYGKVVVIADPQLYTDAIYSAHSYVNNAIMNSPVSSSMLTGLSDSLMYKLKFYYEYYDVSNHIKIFLTHVRNVAKEYLSDYLTHYIDQTLNDFKVGNIPLFYSYLSVFEKLWEKNEKICMYILPAWVTF